MFQRHLASQLLRYAKQYPAIALVGPRQSGKTTLAQALFPKHIYLSLENLDLRNRATDDPRGFLSDYGHRLILDEVQRTPGLFSYLQEIIDKDPKAGQYILTGSHQFLLFEGISQSLAGRIATFKLFPFTYTELKGYAEDHSLNMVFRQWHQQRSVVTSQEMYEFIFSGLYPRIYDQHLDSRKWLENYVLTYVERDVRSLVNIRNVRSFENFLKLCAAQSGQLLNYASLAGAVGVSQPTIREWISILETSGLIFILPPYHRNFSKRIVKTPKVYFLDTGVLCYLLGIREAEQLKSHPLIGSIFETFIVSECYKRMANLGEIPPLYFWRDKTGLEVDLIINQGTSWFPIEIKASQTFNSSFSDSMRQWFTLKGNTADQGLIIYAGKDIVGAHSDIPTVPWFYL